MSNGQSLTFNGGWYVAYTRTRHEKKIAGLMEELNIVNFLPVTQVLRIWHDRKKYVETPLFPSYIFVYLACVKDYYETLNLPGLLCFVKQGKETARVDESVINTLRMATGSRSEIEVIAGSFKPGQKVVIREGPFIGMSCEVVEHRCEDKIIVRLPLLQRNILLSTKVMSLQPVLHG
jgi:transcriptional antiterminator RfaH